MDHSELTKAYRAELSDAAAVCYASEGHFKGAAYAAASKHYKQGICMHFIQEMMELDGADITPTLAKHLIKDWLGRGVSNRFLLKRLGISERTAKDKSKDISNVSVYADKYREQVQTEIVRAEKIMKIVRDEIKELETGVVHVDMSSMANPME